MHEELVKRLIELEVITEHCGEQSCAECANKELCDKYDNKTLTDTYKDAADAIEELLRAAKKMHLWIFLHSGDEQAVYDACGLSDEMNAALGYSGQFDLRAEPPKEDNPR